LCSVYSTAAHTCVIGAQPRVQDVRTAETMAAIGRLVGGG
jgi:hypothetical protein